MEILFSQAPTPHSRLANSLLWMCRCYPELLRSSVANFAFPWAQEKFVDFLDLASPWLREVSPRSAELFQSVSGEHLTAQSLASFCSQLTEDAPIGSKQAAPADSRLHWINSRDGVIAIHRASGNMAFAELLMQAAQADLLICHEPFQLAYGSERFPTQGLDHVAPSAGLLEEAELWQAAVAGSARQSCGLHIRRGDYATWRHGEFFYTDDFWLALCRGLIHAGWHVSVFSNEPGGSLSLALAQLGACLSEGSAPQDLARMMYMDRLIGPPSTFSQVARLLAKCFLHRSLRVERLPSLANVDLPWDKQQSL